MTFDSFINDLKKLEGMHLESIRPGAGIRISLVDLDAQKIVVVSDTGRTQSRPFSQFKTIWEQLMLQPAVHVDEVLHGSGTSRNQPETIFANMPYVEWLRVNGKKRISFVKEASHPFGTLKQMDAMQAAALIERINRKDVDNLIAIIFSSSPQETLKQLQSIFIGNIQTVSQGIYSWESNKEKILVVASLNQEIPWGYYPVIHMKRDFHSEQRLSVCGKMFELIFIHGCRVAVPIDS